MFIEITHMVTTGDRQSSNFAQENPQEVKLQFHLGETCASPKRLQSSYAATMVAPEEETKNHHT
jgi:hypothetical protein